MSQSGRRTKCPQCGGPSERDWAAEWGHRCDRKIWPFYSESLGVMLPEQIPEAVADLKRAGLGGDFDSEGRLKVDSPRHYHRLCKHMGLDRQRHGKERWVQDARGSR